VNAAPSRGAIQVRRAGRHHLGFGVADVTEVAFAIFVVQGLADRLATIVDDVDLDRLGDNVADIMTEPVVAARAGRQGDD
jgi:hypothetical protein